VIPGWLLTKAALAHQSIVKGEEFASLIIGRGTQKAVIRGVQV